MVTAYRADLERIEAEIAALGDDALVEPTDTETITRYVNALYRHAVHTGDLVALETVEPAIDEGIRLLPCAGDLYLLKASLTLKLHRLGDARQALAADPAAAASAQGRAILADIDFQEGHADAEAGYERLIDADPTWENIARLAHFRHRMGAPEEADRLLAEAEDELTAKEMRAFAWLELQRGLVDLGRGRHEETAEHYRRAEQAYCGHWLTAEHRAELLAAEGRYEGAASLYEDVLARVAKPELQQAFGELLELMGETERARPWFERALAGYLAAGERGGVHYYHHLVDFYADVRRDGPEAVHWARRDITLRDNFATRAALAWALHRDGQAAEALDAMRRALASGAEDAHLLSQAAAIHRSAGLGDEADRLAARAKAINPQLGSFHVHR